MLLLVGGVADPKGAVGSGGDGAQAGGMKGQGQRENPQPIKKRKQKQRQKGNRGHRAIKAKFNVGNEVI